MSVQLDTISEYARHRGCDRKTVRDAIKSGRITPVERDGKRLIDRAAADSQWAKNTRARVGSGAPVATLVPPSTSDESGTPSSSQGMSAPAHAPAPADDYAFWSRRDKKADAERKEMENARLANRLLDRERTERIVFEAFRSLRDAVFAATKTQARDVLGLTELREVELALEDELRQAFAGWEERMLAGLRGAPAS